MSSLDEQLDSIVRYILEQGMLSGNGFIRSDGIAKSVESIRKAFTDAGYIPMSQLNQPRNMMTGQAWYERFNKEMSDALFIEAHTKESKLSIGQIAKLAARRAAGINEKETN